MSLYFLHNNDSITCSLLEIGLCTYAYHIINQLTLEQQ